MKYTPCFSLPQSVLQEWQSLVDTIAGIMGVSAGLVMVLDGDDISVLVSSASRGNPYLPGDKESVWDSGLYCEHVIKTQEMLAIPNALVDDKWKNNPDIKLNMISYLGYPINLPDGTPFGTICALDSRERHFSQEHKFLLEKMGDLLQSQIELHHLNHMLEEKCRQLEEQIDEVKTLRGIIPICANCKSIRNDKEHWQRVDDYLMEHTEADLTHSICPDCIKKLYPELADEVLRNKD